MMRPGSVAFAIGVCLLLADTASAQPRWGRERVPQAGACFFEDINFGGRYFCITSGDRLDSMPRGMNDKISSVRVFGGAEVTVFRDSNMRGRSARFAAEVRDLRREGWNDQISSLTVASRNGRGRADRGPAWGREAVPREGACFYRDASFRGDYFCVPRGSRYDSLPREFNNAIRSIRVFDAEVRIFLERDFRGRSAQVRSDVADLRGLWRDNISSIRVW